MEQISLAQGSPQWHAHRRNHWNASDAPAMMGCSPYETRSQLLHRIATGIEPEIDAATQRRFDDGHRAEALARPLAESIIGEDLFPVVGTNGRYSASFDGLTMDETTAFEHKTLNESLRYDWDTGNGYHLPKMYQVQMEHQLIVSGADRVLFMATRWDGDVCVEKKHCWYASDPALRHEILAGWKQFDADLKTYVPTIAKEMPAPEVSVDLPALFIHAKGEITTSNMKEYGEALTARLAQIRAIKLVTDQDFSNAKESAKMLRENREKALLAKDAMLAQTVTVGEAANMIDAWCEDMRLTALQLEKDVEREDKAKKAAMIDTARRAYDAHIEAAKADTGGPWIVLQAPDWAGAIKGKRNFASMQDALDTALAQGKMAADTSARTIRAALAALDETSKGYEHLFADRLSFISKSPEDVRMLARARVTEHEAAEKRRAEAAAELAREAIRKEEQAKAEKEAREKLAAEQAEAKRLADEHAAREAETARQAAAAERERDRIRAEEAARAQAEVMKPAPVAPVRLVQPPTSPAPVTSGARIKLGDINARIAPLSITADGLASLGFSWVATDKASKLYRESDFGAICAALIYRIESATASLAA